MPHNPSCFPLGSYIKSVYSGKVYQITQFYKNGMRNLYQPYLNSNENWNDCNNPHFVRVDIPVEILTVLM